MCRLPGFCSGSASSGLCDLEPGLWSRASVSSSINRLRATQSQAHRTSVALSTVPGGLWTLCFTGSPAGVFRLGQSLERFLSPGVLLLMGEPAPHLHSSCGCPGPGMPPGAAQKVCARWAVGPAWPCGESDGHNQSRTPGPHVKNQAGCSQGPEPSPEGPRPALAGLKATEQRAFSVLDRRKCYARFYDGKESGHGGQCPATAWPGWCPAERQQQCPETVPSRDTAQKGHLEWWS